MSKTAHDLCLERSIDALSVDQGAELEELLLGCANAAEALKRAYLEALTQASNLPPYERLVRSPE